jgi:hypothetical protein
MSAVHQIKLCAVMNPVFMQPLLSMRRRQSSFLAATKDPQPGGEGNLKGGSMEEQRGSYA